MEPLVYTPRAAKRLHCINHDLAPILLLQNGANTSQQRLYPNPALQNAPAPRNKDFTTILADMPAPSNNDFTPGLPQDVEWPVTMTMLMIVPISQLGTLSDAMSRDLRTARISEAL